MGRYANVKQYKRMRAAIKRSMPGNLYDGHTLDKSRRVVGIVTHSDVTAALYRRLALQPR